MKVVEKENKDLKQKVISIGTHLDSFHFLNYMFLMNPQNSKYLFLNSGSSVEARVDICRDC